MGEPRVGAREVLVKPSRGSGNGSWEKVGSLGEKRAVGMMACMSHLGLTAGFLSLDIIDILRQRRSFLKGTVLHIENH